MVYRETTRRPTMILLMLLLSSLIMLISGQNQSSPDQQDTEWLGSPQQLLMDELFNKREPPYTKIVRPIGDESTPVNVTLQLVLTDITGVDEKHHQVALIVWSRLSWRDEYLTWNPSDFGDKDLEVFPAWRVWIPDIVLYNSISDNSGVYLQEGNVIVRADGSVNFSARLNLVFQCTMILTKFPFDEQKCELGFASWSQDGSLINLDLKDINPFDVYSEFHENGEWELVDAGAYQFVNSYEQSVANDLKPNESVTVNWPEVYFTMTLRRKHRFYLLTLLLPYYLISALSGLVFVIQPDTGEKMGLATTVLLSLVVFNEYVTGIVPPSADHFPLLGDYFVIMIFWVGMSVVMSACVLYMYHQDRKTCKWMGPYMRFIVFGFMARVVRDSNTQGSANSESNVEGNAMNMQTMESNGVITTSEIDEQGSKLELEVRRIRKFLEDVKKEKDAENMMTEVEDGPLEEWREAVRIIDKFFFWTYTIINAFLMLVFLLLSLYYAL